MWRWRSRRRKEIGSSRQRRRSDLRAIARPYRAAAATAAADIKTPQAKAQSPAEAFRRYALPKGIALVVKLPQKLNRRKPTIQLAPTTLFCWAEAWVKQLHQEAAPEAGGEEVEVGAASAALGVKAVAPGIRLAEEVDRAVEAAPEVADLVAVVLVVEVALVAGHAIAPPRIASEGILRSSIPTQPLMRTLIL